MGEFADEASARADRTSSLTLWQLLVHQPESADERINLRLWFGAFLAYMIALIVGILVGVYLEYAGVTRWGTALFVTAGMMFYLSLCCTFVPLPTTGIILAVGSSSALTSLLDFLGLQGPELEQALDGTMEGWVRITVVAVLGGLATTMANLNEYHIFTFLLRYKRIGKVRETRLHAWAGKWFNKGPFVLLATFCFVLDVGRPASASALCASKHQPKRILTSFGVVGSAIASGSAPGATQHRLLETP